MQKKSSWGMLSNHYHNVHKLYDRSSCTKIIEESLPGTAYGNGRSYGDVCLNPNGNLWVTSSLNKFIKFDRHNGILECESGILLKDINKLTIPFGWMLPVTPGTQHGTVGGSIANDIHGKNHHRFGSFGNHIEEISLIRTNGEMIICSPKKNDKIFYSTIGGIGLTGIIIATKIKLRRIESAFIESENIPYYSLDEFFSLSKESESSWEHTVSWLDCTAGGMGKGIFTRSNFTNDGNFSIPKKIEIKIPFKPPISLVNSISLNIFNKIYFASSKLNKKVRIESYDKSLYPLDNLLEWNKIYGKKGFYQYQSVIPKNNSHDATIEMLDIIKTSGEGSFLAVLKTFDNKKSLGLLSFPMEGTTLALDFPNKGPKTLKLFEKLDDVVMKSGGRIYMAKDNRMSREMFEAGYPNYDKFKEYIDPGISSSMSRRLFDF